MQVFAERLHRVQCELAEAAVLAGRDPQTVHLIAVSKGQPRDAVLEALRAGQRAFGENYVQEAAGKFDALADTWPGLTCHLIGALQTNKAVQAARLFTSLDTIDRPGLVAELVKMRDKDIKLPRLCVEVNIGREPQKAGVHPESLADLLGLCRETYRLEVDGLMAVPPAEDDPAPYFAAAQELAARHRLSRLSIGMSRDYRIAIYYGATEVRIGTALFGPRGRG